jgi:type IV pilus assembly protein PilX
MSFTGIRRPRNGVALFVGIILLIILSLFVLGAMRDVLLQERMAGAYRNSAMAENVVDSLQREGHRFVVDEAIKAGGIAPELGVFSSRDNSDFRMTTGYTTDRDAAQDYSGPEGDTLSQPGTFSVEGAVKILSNGKTQSGDLQSQLASYTSVTNYDVVLYRVTAKATGGTDDFVRTAESTYIVGSSRTTQ